MALKWSSVVRSCSEGLILLRDDPTWVPRIETCFVAGSYAALGVSFSSFSTLFRTFLLEGLPRPILWLLA